MSLTPDDGAGAVPVSAPGSEPVPVATSARPVRELRLVVTADDYEAAVAFYRDVLGMPESAEYVSEDGGKVIILEAGRATLEIGDPAHAVYVDEVEVGRPVAGHLRVALQVDRVEELTQAAQAAGAALVAAPVATPWGSRNARLDGPGALHLTLFEEGGHSS